MFEHHKDIITPDDPKNPGDSTDRNEVQYPDGVKESDLNKDDDRTIYYKKDTEDGEDISDPVTQKSHIERIARFNYVTKEITYEEWTTDTVPEQESPEIPHWQTDRLKVDGVTINHESAPMEDEYVIYTKVEEKGSVRFVDDGDTDIADKVPLQGYDEDPFNYDPQETMDYLHNGGWDLTNNGYPKEEDRFFDSDPTVDQDYVIAYTPHIEKIPYNDPKAPGTPTDRGRVNYPEGVDEADLNKTFTRTIYYKYEDGTQAKEPETQTVTLHRDAYFNYVTGNVEYSNWTTDKMGNVESPVIDGYTADILNVDGLDITVESNPEDVTVTYRKNPENTPENPGTYDTAAPDTGDSNGISVVAPIAGAGIAGLAIAGVALKKRKKEDE